MVDQLVSLSKIFSEAIFRIPDYQRGYSWGEKELEDFWNDLLRLQKGKNHYVGVLTLELVPEEIYNKWSDDTWLINSKHYTPFYVVDGQQRLTTSILLIYAITKMMVGTANHIKLNYTSKDEVLKKFIYESKDENFSQTYLFAYEDSNPSYTYLITKIFNQISEKSTSTVEETTYTTNLDFAKNYFLNKLKSLDHTDLENVYTKITQHFLFNTYLISSDIDVHVTFETMNNRGKPLSYLELLKNRLIYLSTLFDEDDALKSRLRQSINDCWKDIYTYLGKNKTMLLPDDEFLNAHFILYFSDIINTKFKGSRSRYKNSRAITPPQTFLLDNFFIPQKISSKELTPHTIFDYIRHLKRSVSIWYSINNPSNSSFNEDITEYLSKLNYLSFSLDRRYWGYPFGFNAYSASSIKVLLLACLNKTHQETDLLRLLKNLEKYLFLSTLYPFECFATHKDIILDLNSIINEIQSDTLTLTVLSDKLEKLCSFITSNQDFYSILINAYNKNGFYETPFLRYFLCEYELNLIKISKSHIQRLDRNLYFNNAYNSLEHIYPQNCNYKYWNDLYKGYTPKQKKSLKNSLGNLVILSKEKNSKLANKPFPEKKSNLENSLGYHYGTYSEMELCHYEDWTSDAILKRGLKQIEFLQKRWGLSFNKKQDKILFLGLDFLNKK